MNSKQLFAIGGFMALGLLSFWLWKTSAPGEAVSEEPASAKLQISENKASGSKDSKEVLPTPPSGDSAKLVTPTEQKPGDVQVPTEAKATWKKPDTPVYWDQTPAQKQAIDFFTKLGEMKFPAAEKPLYVGINDQGFDQYQYRSANGANVTQWKRSNEVVIEEAVLENGDKITRKAVEQDNPLSSVAYESKANKTYQRTTYRANGSVDSLRMDENGHTTIYWYDEQGRVRETYSGPTPK